MRKIASYILNIIGAVIILCYGIGCIAPYIPPTTITLPAYFGLAFPALWISMVLLFIVSILFRHWSMSIVSVIIMVATFGIWKKTIIVNSITKNTAELNIDNRNTLKILTFNVGMFNANRNLEAFVKFIKQTDADIVCLQEFGYYISASSQSEILNRFDSIYPYRHLWYKNQSRRIYSGLATFSRYPIVKKEKIQYKSEHNVSIFSDIVYLGDTIRVLNNHLESNRLNPQERDIAKLLDDGTSRDEIVSHSLLLQSKLGAAMKIRARQAEAIRYTISRTKHHVIVAGDFNDVPQSYTYRIISSGLTDAYATTGRWGYYWTFNAMPMLFPIDHILVSDKIKVIDTSIPHIQLSDHYPMTATVSISDRN